MTDNPVKEYPFHITCPANKSWGEYPLPHFATEHPIGLHIHALSQGITVADIKWANNSYFACSGSIDPRLFGFLKPVPFLFERPKYMEDLKLCISNLSHSNASLKGTLYSQQMQSPPSLQTFMFPLSPLHPGVQWPWLHDIAPGTTLRLQARSQLTGILKQFLMTAEHLAMIQSGKIVIKAQAAQYAKSFLSTKKNQLDQNTARSIGLIIDGNFAHATKTSAIQAGECFAMDVTNNGDTPVKDFSIAATFEVRT